MSDKTKITRETNLLKSTSKLTAAQIQENVQMLVHDFYIGNGEPSLRQTVRDTHTLLLDVMKKFEAKEEEHRLEKEKLDKEKYDTLVQSQKEIADSKKFWSRTVAVLVLTQIITIIFSYFQ